MGRNDFQVKVRGYRIELGEIEARLLEIDAVREAVVVAHGDRLDAYYVPDSSIGVETLRDALSEVLPSYMVPSAFVALESLPLTPNGKVDRDKLPVPDGGAVVARGYRAPVGVVEEVLAGIWSDLLNVERVGRDDDFFELGGHSLLAVSLVERMRQAGLSCDVRAVFTTPTVAGLAAAVAAGGGAEVSVPPNAIPADADVITPGMLPLVDLTEEQITKVVASVSGGAGNVQDIYPLAPLQEGFLFHHAMHEDGDPYLLSFLLTMDTRAAVDQFTAAVQSVLDRHDILRTSVAWDGLPRPVQVVWRHAALPVEELSLDGAVDAAAELQARFEPRHYRLDLGTAPLLRVATAYDEPNERWLLLVLMHHLVGDHTTLDVMREEIRALLTGRAGALPEPVPYRNVVGQAVLGTTQQEHEEFFTELLGDVDESTAPYGLLDVRGDGTRMATVCVELDPAVARSLREQAHQRGVSPASVCHLAWGLALSRLTGRSDVVFGTGLFGRLSGGDGADRGIGLFINTLPVRIAVGTASAADAVRGTHHLLADLLAHEHAPLMVAQRCSRVAAPAPLFTSLLVYRHSPVTAAEPDTEATPWSGMQVLQADERTTYPVDVTVDDLGEGFVLTVKVAEPVDPERVCALFGSALTTVTEALERAPGTPVRDLDVLPADERDLVLTAFPEAVGRRVYILDPQDRPAPIGVTGELAVGELAVGELAVGQPGAGLRRTGEHGRWRADGTLEVVTPEGEAGDVPGRTGPAEPAYEAPRGEVEEKIAEIWARLLDVHRIGRHDSFFERGGQSLLAIQVGLECKRAGLDVTVADLFAYPRLKDLAHALAGRSGAAGPAALEDRAVVLRAGDRRRAPLFLVHDGDGYLLYGRALLPYLDEDQPVYGLPVDPAGPDGMRTVEGSAARMVRLIRQVQPEGPYRVAGYSSGGTLAYEIGVQLRGLDQRVDFVGLIDTHFPGDAGFFADVLDSDEGFLLRMYERLAQGDPDWEAKVRGLAASGPHDFTALVEAVGAVWPSEMTVTEFRAAVSAMRAMLRAETGYVVQPSTVPVHLFRAAEPTGSAEPDEMLGWGRVLTPHTVTVTTVPGDHQTMLVAPNLDRFGADFAAALHSVGTPRRADTYQPVVTLQRGRPGTHPTVFCVPGAGAGVVSFSDLVSRLGRDWTVYGLQPRGLDGTDVPHSSVTAAARAYLDGIARTGIGGPLHLVGHSFGGWVAYEMATMLRAEGRDVTLTIVDSEVPDPAGAPARQHSHLQVLTRWLEVFELTVEQPLGLTAERLAAQPLTAQLTAVHGRLVHFGLASARTTPSYLRGPLTTFAAAVRTTYTPRHAYPGPVHMVFADDPRQTEAENDLECAERERGWAAWIADLHVSRAPGNHMTTLDTPHVDAIAALLRQRRTDC
ncbi:alpha/beta fold hydrolase [Wenjunlia tyrosinilytica]|uniref:alpha/beta fold hydrolase n=1 Tax=Wenjunlia tyrosinilytica TaxID=1544741 RepID=UPI00166AE913|nr:alpha/beta fold hydrolase [Wenjunlia tyrosinilytica]